MMSHVSERARRRERQRGRGIDPRRAGASARKSVWRGPLPIAAVVIGVVALVAIFIATARAPTAPAPSPGVSAAVVSQVTSIPPSVFDAVGAGTAATIVKAAPAGAVLKGSSGKPLILYVGAEYCPYCASERWSFIVALSRFGSWSGLSLTRSSSTDVFPDTPTFTFRGAGYQSDLLELSAVETSDREGKPIASMTPVQQSSLTRFDTSGSIPFISIADRYYSVGAGYSPDILSGKSWDEIAAALHDPSSPVAKAVIGHADRLTAAICAVTGQQPAQVCSSPAIKGITPPSP
jgi:uncharacterized protein DUF929